ncbi:hemerythrin domain-containing protein [Pseudophaeobacter arcticus]|jgi:regulator of cell morphogenesis and NO signaling|uniref:hemerythrin domain-containing protein n=1 Tax=Pseudophaeobacter arcticus TaxID=385492 RepID=UPI000409A74F|nr:hemerythrin domain-containing protein [Pseudophaeobacter arcticus]
MLTPDSEMSTPTLINYIQERFLQAHRQEMPELVRLARKVETKHADDIDAPHGLTQALQSVARHLEPHIHEEEAVVFLALNEGKLGQMRETFARLRNDHAEQETALNRIAAMTHGFRLPRTACKSWRSLYAGLGKLAEDLDEHRYLENEVLFPRFEKALQSPGQETSRR